MKQALNKNATTAICILAGLVGSAPLTGCDELDLIGTQIPEGIVARGALLVPVSSSMMQAVVNQAQAERVGGGIVLPDPVRERPDGHSFPPARSKREDTDTGAARSLSEHSR